jgi:GNAT superfamily N-acetyltransferase
MRTWMGWPSTEGQRTGETDSAVASRNEPVWVGVDGGEVAGFVSVGPSRDEDAAADTGELYAIYVLAEHQGRGVGQETSATRLIHVKSNVSATPPTIPAYSRTGSTYGSGSLNAYAARGRENAGPSGHDRRARGGRGVFESEEEGLGEELLEEVSRGLAVISESPMIWPLVRRRGSLRSFVLSRFPFTIIYDVRGDRVRVFAIAHQRSRQLRIRGDPRCDLTWSAARASGRRTASGPMPVAPQARTTAAVLGDPAAARGSARSPT